MGLKMSEVLMILVLAVLLFGGSRVAGLGSSLGQAIRNFKKGLNGEEDEAAKPALQTASSVDANAASRSAANVTKES